MAYTDRDTYGMYKNYGKEGSGPGPRLMGADTLIGEDVYNQKDEDLGDIKEIMLDMNNGKIAYAVLSFGGFMGMGDKLFAVPWNALTLDTENKRFILNVDKERLESAPGFDKDDWPDMADPTWQNTIHSYYGTKSYMDTSHTETKSTKDYTTPPRRNNERIIPVAPVGTDHVVDKTDDAFHTHK
jgi:sporulation protein YlmC with PRC-barrel domain